VTNLASAGTHQRGRIRTPALALVMLSVGLACGYGNASADANATLQPASADVKLTRVHWPAIRRNGIGQIKTDGNRTWALTIVPVPLHNGNLFKLDPVSLAVRKIAVTVPFAQIFAGDGQVWGLPDGGGSLYSVDPSTGKLESRKLPAACGLPPDVAGVVRLGKLWLSCHGVVAAYKPRRANAELYHAVRASTVLGSTRGVWLLARRSLVGVAGDAKGRHIDLPHASDLLSWQSQGDEAWALDSLSGKALIRVNLVSGVIRRFALLTQGQRIDSFTVGPRDVWVTLADPATLQQKALLLRYDRAHPQRPLLRLDLSDKAQSNDFQLFLSTGPSYLWVDLFSNRQSQLFRVTVRK
jgi:hypothetical protein